AALFSAGAIALALRPRTWVLKPIFAALALLMLQLGPRALSWTVLTAVGLCCVVELFSFLVAIESTPRKHPLHALSRRAARLYVELACVDRMRRRLPMVWGFCGVVALGALLEPV